MKLNCTRNETCIVNFHVISCALVFFASLSHLADFSRIVCSWLKGLRGRSPFQLLHLRIISLLTHFLPQRFFSLNNQFPFVSKSIFYRRFPSCDRPYKSVPRRSAVNFLHWSTTFFPELCLPTRTRGG